MILKYKNLKDVKISGTGGGTHTIFGEPTSDAEESFEHGRSIAISDMQTQHILNELKRRYRKEAAILDYIEMIECGVKYCDRRCKRT